MIKICPVCGKESKALHLHMRSHKAETKPNVEEVEPVTQPVAEPMHSEPEPTHSEPESTHLEAKDIPITPEMTETPAEAEPITNVNNCEYQLIMNINNEQLECFTNNLKISILSYARPVVTDGFITIKKGTAEFVKKMSLIQLKQIFTDPQSLEIFLEGFYGLYGRPISEQRVNNLI